MDEKTAKEIIDRVGELPPDRQEAILDCLGVRKKGIDLSVPHLKLSARYKTSSKTEVQWEEGFYGRITFVRWHRFDEIVKETWEKIQQLPAHEFFYPSMDLARLRKIVKGERSQQGVGVTPVVDKKDEGSGPEQTEDAVLHASSERVQELSSFIPPVNQNNSSEPLQYEKPVEPITRIIGVVEEQHGEIFTDEKSTTGVNNYVFMTALSLLRGLRDEKHLFYRCHAFSSEIIKQQNPTVSRLPRATTVHPDQSLVTEKDSHVHKVQPVCTFEFKGPGLDICGLRGSCAPFEKTEEPNEGTTFSDEHEKAGVSDDKYLEEQPDEITPDKSTYSAEMLLEMKEEKLAKELLTFLNSLFPEGRSSRDFEGWTYRKVQRAISQTITQGLISKTGNCFLFNFEVGMAFEIQGKDDTGKLIVAVSRPFECNKQKGTLAAIIAQGYHSLRRLDNERELPFRIREFAQVISAATSEFYTMPVIQKGKRRYQKGNQDSQADRRSKRDRTGNQACTSVHGNRSCDKDEDNLESGPESEDGSMHSKDDERRSKQMALSRHCNTESSGSTVTQDESLEQSLKNEISELFLNNEGVIGVGRSGTVLLGVWKGKKAAIKSWNFESEHGFLDLCKEIDMYL